MGSAKRPLPRVCKVKTNMCLAAIPLLSFAVGAAQAVMGFQAQSQQAEQQNEYYRQNAIAANKAAMNNYANLQNNAIQKRNAAGAEGLETKIEAIKARGTARTAAGESGVSGLSVDALVNDYYGREGRHLDSIDQNYAMDRDYIRGEMDNTKATAEQRINSVQRATPPSFADAAIRIAGAAVNSMGQYQRQQFAGYGGNTQQMSFA